jgi:hypothetical protein
MLYKIIKKYAPCLLLSSSGFIPVVRLRCDTPPHTALAISIHHRHGQLHLMYGRHGPLSEAEHSPPHIHTRRSTNYSTHIHRQAPASGKQPQNLISLTNNPAGVVLILGLELYKPDLYFKDRAPPYCIMNMRYVPRHWALLYAFHLHKAPVRY